MKHDWFKHTITLVTDETGLDTMVTWPYIRQTAEIGSWLNGGEMIFVFHQAAILVHIDNQERTILENMDKAGN